MGSGKSTDATDAATVEEVAAGEEDVEDIRISPKTPVMVLTSKIFLGISAVTIDITFRGTV